MIQKADYENILQQGFAFDFNFFGVKSNIGLL